MQVQIVSIQAALRGRPSIVWLGDVDASDLELPDVAQMLVRHGGAASTPVEGDVNAALFRFFNRVDDGDNERLSDIGFLLPSLSVGDLIHWNSKTFRVAGSGFEQITDSPDYVMALTAYTLKTMSRDEVERGI